jgi:dCMP deaminase
VEIKAMKKSWIQKYMDLAEFLTAWSKDESTKVAAVIVSPHNTPVSFGYNGPPRGFPDDYPELKYRPSKYNFVIHAELNAILNAGIDGKPLTDCILFCTHHPCANCAGAIAQVGIKEVYYLRDMDPRWVLSTNAARVIFNQCGVKCEQI